MTRVRIFKNMGRNILGGNFLGGTFLGGGVIHQREFDGQEYQEELDIQKK